MACTIAVNKLTFENLKPLVEDLATNETYKRNAQHMAQSMHQEDFKEELYNFIVR